MASLDNLGAIHFPANPMFHARTKVIEVDYHFVEKGYRGKLLVVRFVPTSGQVVDGFTKPLSYLQLELFNINLNLVLCD